MRMKKGEFMSVIYITWIPGWCGVGRAVREGSVTQVFAMMVDLEEEEDWSLQDEVENEDEER